MSEHLQVTTVTRNGRISLGKRAMKVLGIEEGQQVQLFEQNGVVYIGKVSIPDVVEA
jgi:bifunctional DNA-binding transcriptional regulator/antitoxin component of YhaV-PrlF toxin-antitoxin module